MTDQPHPEDPVDHGDLTKFIFNFSHVPEARAQLDRQAEAVDQRVEKILNAEKFQVNGMPILRMILQVVDEPDKLKEISKALDRLGDILPAANDLAAKRSVLDVAERDAGWMAGAFADVDGALDEGLEDLLNEGLD